jgi:hypothetical protein
MSPRSVVTIGAAAMALVDRRRTKAAPDPTPVAPPMVRGRS